MHDGLKKCKDRAMRMSGSDSKGGYGYDKDKDDMTKGSYMNEDMADEKGMYEDKGSTAGCNCPGCKDCKKMGGCTKNMCVGHTKYWESKEEDAEEKSKRGTCWVGYRQDGMKKGKNGNLVPNCVPIEGKIMEFAEFELLKEQLNSLRVVLD